MEKTNLKTLKSVLAKLQKTAKRISQKVLDIEKEREKVEIQISGTYKVKSPKVVYEKSLVDFIEMADECLDAKNFFSLRDGIFVPDENMEFLYSLWTGEYYTDLSEIPALQKYISDLESRLDEDFLIFCKRYSQ